MANQLLHISGRLPGDDRFDAELEVKHLVFIPNNAQRSVVLFVRVRATKRAIELHELKYRGPFTVWIVDGTQHYYLDYHAHISASEHYTFIPGAESYKSKKHRYKAIDVYFRSERYPAFINHPEKAEVKP